MRHAWGLMLALTAGAAAQERALFDGRSLAGWTKMHDGEFSVARGVLVLDKGNGWLRSDAEFGDFDLTVEWRADPQYAGGKMYDSGLFFRTKAEGKPWPPGKYQFNMKQTTGGELSGIVKDGRPDLLKPAGQWNTYRLQCVGAVALDDRAAAFVRLQKRRAECWLSTTQRDGSEGSLASVLNVTRVKLALVVCLNLLLRHVVLNASKDEATRPVPLVAQIAKRPFVPETGTGVFILSLAVENKQLTSLFLMVDDEVVLASLRLALKVQRIPVKAVFVRRPV